MIGGAVSGRVDSYYMARPGEEGDYLGELVCGARGLMKENDRRGCGVTGEDYVHTA